MNKLLLLMTLAAPLILGQTPGQAPPAGKQSPPQGTPPKLNRLPDGTWTANRQPASVDNFEIHVVKQGDTLSGLAQQYLQNLRLWPQLWEANEHILNPHWIYPNDRILIRRVTQITEVPPPASPPPPAPAPAPPPPARPAPPPASPPPAPAGPTFDIQVGKSAPEIKESDVACAGFIAADALPGDLRIAGKVDNDPSFLATRDEYVYLNRGTNGGVQPGQAFSAVRLTRKVNGLRNKAELLGTHYLDLGEVTVAVARPDFAIARVGRVCEALSAGDVLIPAQPIVVPAPPRGRRFESFMAPSGKAAGLVVVSRNVLVNIGTKVLKATPSKLSYLDGGSAGTGDIVYLDLGRRNGIQAGDVFLIYRESGKDNAIPLPASELSLPRERLLIGELVVVKVQEKTASAIVTYSLDAVFAGDSVEIR